MTQSSRSYVQEAIPKIVIKKIFVTSNRVNLQLSMKRPSSYNFSSWNGMAGINLMKYLNFHAFISQSVHGDFRRNVASINNRINFLAPSERNQNSGPIHWEDTLSGRSYGLNGHAKVNIIDIFQGNSQSQDPLVA